MNKLLIIIFGFTAGIILGSFFFGGLWLTLKRLPSTQNPLLLILGSFSGRIVICIIGFYIVVKAGNLSGLLASLAGFMLIRFMLVRHLRPGEQSFFRKGSKWLK